MSGIIGNNIVKNGLVLCLDAGSPKSCTGQPVTNLLTYSDTINSVWYGYCGPTSNITYNTTDVTDPSGTNTAVKVVRNGSNGCFGGGDVAMGLLHAQASDFLVAGKTYTTSVYLRGSVGGETIYFGLNDTHQGSVNVTTSWVRYSYTFTNISSTSRGFQFVDYGINHTYYVWGPQTVLGAVAGDYVASVGATNGTKNLTFRDLSGNNNNGTFTNAPVFSSSNLGVITFDGVDDYVSIPYSSNFDRNDFTIVGFIKTSTDDNTHDQVISRNHDVYDSTIKGWNISRLRNGLFPANGLRLMISDGSTGGDLFGPAISTNTWTHFAFVINKSVDGKAYVYINGSLYNTLSSLPSGNYYPTSGNPPIYIGCNKNIADFWTGQIAQISYYSRALSASEILQNFNATRKRFNI